MAILVLRAGGPISVHVLPWLTLPRALAVCDA